MLPQPYALCLSGREKDKVRRPQRALPSIQSSSGFVCRPGPSVSDNQVAKGWSINSNRQRLLPGTRDNSVIPELANVLALGDPEPMPFPINAVRPLVSTVGPRGWPRGHVCCVFSPSVGGSAPRAPLLRELPGSRICYFPTFLKPQRTLTAPTNLISIRGNPLERPIHDPRNPQQLNKSYSGCHSCWHCPFSH